MVDLYIAKSGLLVPIVTTSVLNVPSAPVIGAAVAGDREATVSFTESLDNGGSPIIQYRVTSSSGHIAYGSGSPVKVLGLTNGNSYTFTVAAQNSVGWSTESSPSNQVTPTSGSGTYPQSDAEIGLEGIGVNPNDLIRIEFNGDYTDTYSSAGDFHGGSGTYGDPYIITGQWNDREIYIPSGTFSSQTYVKVHTMQIGGTSNWGVRNDDSNVYLIVEDCNIGLVGHRIVGVCIHSAGGGEFRRIRFHSFGDCIRLYKTCVVEDIRATESRMAWNGGNTGSYALDYKHVDFLQCTDRTRVTLTARRNYADLLAYISEGWAAGTYKGGNSGHQYKPTDGSGPYDILHENSWIRSHSSGLNIEGALDNNPSTHTVRNTVLVPAEGSSFDSSAVNMGQSAEATGNNTNYILDGVRKADGTLWYPGADLQG